MKIFTMVAFIALTILISISTLMGGFTTFESIVMLTPLYIAYIKGEKNAE